MGEIVPSAIYTSWQVSSYTRYDDSAAIYAGTRSILALIHRPIPLTESHVTKSLTVKPVKVWSAFYALPRNCDRFGLFIA